METKTNAEARPAPARYAGARNALIGVGGFYVSRWIAALLRTSLAGLVDGVMTADGPGGGVRQVLLTPFVGSLSHALAAAFAGAVVVLLVDSTQSGDLGDLAGSTAGSSSAVPASSATSPTSVRWRWAIIPAVLWFVASLDEVTISAPGWLHLATQLIAAALPSIVCLAAGHLADWHRSR